MADHADEAEKLNELAMKEAFHKHQNRQPTLGETSATWCVECDEVIPQARRKVIIGVQTCIDCANELEQQNRR